MATNTGTKELQTLRTQDTSDPGDFGTSLVGPNYSDRSALVPKCPKYRTVMPQVRKCFPPFLSTMVCRLPVNSSHGHLVTRSCRLTVNSSPVNSSHTRLVIKSTRHKQAHKKAIPVAIFFYLHAGQVAPINSAKHGRRDYVKRVYTRHTQCCAVRFAYFGLICVILKSPMTVKLLNATNARSKSTVNSSQRLQTRQSTRHTILRCDELTM